MAASADSGGAVNEASMSPVFIYNDSVIGPDFEWLRALYPQERQPFAAAPVYAAGVRLRDFDDEARSSVTHQNVKFSFAFARHPETRVVSTWRNKIESGAGHPGAIKAHTEVAWFAGRNGIERVRRVARRGPASAEGGR